jgi:hypothetical protein
MKVTISMNKYPILSTLAAFALPLFAAAQADGAVLRCQYEEIYTNTSGEVQKTSQQQILQIGGDAYRIWQAESSGWGENLCNFGTCSLKGNEFIYSSDDNSVEGGQRNDYVEKLTIELDSGHLAREKMNSYTKIITGYLFEYTWYDNGQCVAIRNAPQ